MARSKTKRRAVRNDIYSDLNKIKTAFKDGAGELFNHRLNDLQDKTSDIEANVVDYVTDQPIKALCFAVLAGIFVGLYIRK